MNFTYEKFQEVLDMSFLGNTVDQYLSAVAVFFGLLIVFKIFKAIVVRRLHGLARRSKNKLDDELVKVIQKISWIFYFVVALYFAIHLLSVPDSWMKIVDGIFLVVVVYRVVKSLQDLIEYALLRVSGEKGTTFVGMRLVIRVVLWIVAILLILSNLGINVTSLIASLGIGGLAVAFAMQNILADLFSSFSIYFDKPFGIGDTIKIGDQAGTVKHIGLKTTRVQTLQGEELVISNSELTSSQVRNFGKMKQRRSVMNIGVEYGTSVKKLKKISEIFEKVLGKMDDVELDRCRFMEFGDSALMFEVVFHVMNGDYADYAKKQEIVNFEVVKAFEKNKIEMAFPTQTIHVKKG